MKQNWINQISPKVGYYIAGFVDGEGSFNVSVKKCKDRRLGWKVEPLFNVSQKDKVILALLKRWLKCGKIRQRKDGIFYYEVRNINALQNNVIPFFEKFSFLSNKTKKNFSIFRKIVKKIVQGEHLKEEGLREILKLRERLNEGRGRKRKYTFDDVIN